MCWWQRTSPSTPSGSAPSIGTTSPASPGAIRPIGLGAQTTNVASSSRAETWP
jgi:hypothetical protein